MRAVQDSLVPQPGPQKPVASHLDAKKKLHLGCGTRILPDYLNLDLVDGPGVDLVCDASEGLPFPDDRFDEILAVDFFEHIRPERSIPLMNDCYRVLVGGGRLRMHVPEAPGITAFQDPTHVSFWNEESFSYYIEGDARRERFGVPYGVSARFEMHRLVRRRHMWKKFFTTGNFNYLLNYVLDVELAAVK